MLGSKKNTRKKLPITSIIILGIITFICIFSEFFAPYPPDKLFLDNLFSEPNKQFIFGTDSLGRDLCSVIIYGGKVSLQIGVLSSGIATIIGVMYGCVSGFLGEKIDYIMMSFLGILFSIPSILLVIFVQGIARSEGVITLAIVIGSTQWMNLAKIVRTEVKQIKNKQYVVYARSQGASFWYVLKTYLIPELVSSTVFMIVTLVGTAIGTEATLSFFGIGLPTNIISIGTLMSQGDRVLLSNKWWIIVIPGLFLTTILLCIARIGNCIRKKVYKGCSNL